LTLKRHDLEHTALSITLKSDRQHSIKLKVNLNMEIYIYITLPSSDVANLEANFSSLSRFSKSDFLVVVTLRPLGAVQT
jgi:hypothetical protein